MPAVASLLEAASSAINAAALAGDFSHHLTAVEDFAATIQQSQLYDLTVYVQPGPSSTSPDTLTGVNRDEVSVRVVISVFVPPANRAAIKTLLSLVEEIGDALQSRIASRNFVFVDSFSEDELPYDEERLRNDGIFHSVMLYSFETKRSIS